MDTNETEQLNTAIETLRELLRKKVATEFTPVSAAFEAQDAVNIFSNKKPSDFTVDWIEEKEDVLFFLPDIIFLNFFPAFLLVSARELKEKQNMIKTESLFCILVRKNYSNQKSAIDFIKQYIWCFVPLIQHSVEIGIIGENEAKVFLDSYQVCSKI